MGKKGQMIQVARKLQHNKSTIVLVNDTHDVRRLNN